MKAIASTLPGLVLISGMVAFPATTLAQSSTGAGPYVGGGIGYFRLNDDDFFEEDNDFRDNRTSLSGHVGVQFNPIISIEGGYTDFRELNDGQFELSADGTFAAVIAHVPLTPGFAPYAKLGQLWWDVDREGPQVLGGRTRRTDSGSDTFYGFGMRFGEGPGLQLRVEYDRMALGDTDVDKGSINLQYRF